MESYKIKIQQLEDGTLFLPLPEEMLKQLSLEAGDEYETEFDEKSGELRYLFAKLKNN